jgi:GAF domain-containing protein
LEPISAVISSRRAQLAQQEALAETASLFRASAEMNAVQSYDDILSVVRKYTIAGQDAQSVSLSMFDRPWTNSQMPELVEVLKYHTTREDVSIPTRFPLDQFPSAQKILKPDEPTIIEDLDDPEFDIDDNTRTLYTQIFGAKAIIFAPLVAGGQWIGYINVLYKNKREFSESNVRRLASIAGQSAVAIQNLGLLEETSRKAQREQMLREITAQVRSSADVDTIMKTAVQEIGRALGRRTSISLQTHNKTKVGTSPLAEENGA